MGRCKKIVSGVRSPKPWGRPAPETSITVGCLGACDNRYTPATGRKCCNWEYAERRLYSSWMHSWCSSGYRITGRDPRSEEHTSELQSRGHLVFRILLEKR